MNIQDFKSLATHRFNVCLELLLDSKHKEYTRMGDKLWNFKRAGHLLDVSPEEALLGMWSKHLVSIIDIVRDLEEGFNPSPNYQEKFTDAINYLVLLEALIEEAIGNSPSK